MSIELYITYVLATTLILILPGPTIILVIGQAVAHGRRSVIPLVAGVVCGDLIAMSLSLLGLGAILAASAALFSLFKWIGALYLLYLGIRLWRQPVSLEDASCASPSFFRRSLIVTALNPKSIAFFVAFLPQFIHPSAAVLPQLLLLGATFLVLAMINAALYAVFAGQLRDIMKTKKVRKLFNRCGGSALIGAGVVTAGLQRSA